MTDKRNINFNSTCSNSSKNYIKPKNFSKLSSRNPKLSKLMFAMTCFLLVSSFLTIKSSHLETEQKISTLNILMPTCISNSERNKSSTTDSSDCNAVYFLLKAYHGCYTWSFEESNSYSLITKSNSNKLDIIELETKETVLPRQHEEESNSLCFNNVYLKSRVEYFEGIENQHLWLIASEKNTKKQFRVRVGFSKLHMLQITKRFDVINIDEIVELDLQAFDVKGNMFSSLEGLSFKWYFNEIKHSEFAVLTKLIDEKKHCSEYRREIESKAFWSDLVLLKGKNSGKIAIKAELVDSKMGNLVSLEKNIYVIDSFIVYPKELFILPFKSFKFKLLKENLPKSIALKKSIANTSLNAFKQGLLSASLDNNSSFNFVELFGITDYYNFNWNFVSSSTTCGEFENIDKSTVSYIPFKAKISDNFQKNNFSNCSNEFTVTDLRTDDFNSAKANVSIVTPNLLELGIKEITEDQLLIILRSFNIDKEKDYKSNKRELVVTQEVLFKLSNNSNSNLLFQVFDFLDYNKSTTSYSFEFKNVWKLTVGKFYLISHFIQYDNNLIYFSEEDVEFNILETNNNLLSKYLKFVACFNKQQVCLVTPIVNNVVSEQNKISTSQLNLNSAVKVIYNDTNSTTLTSSKEIFIYSKISVEKFKTQRFTLPLLSPPQELRLIVTGGSGNYYLESKSNINNYSTNVIEISTSGTNFNNIVYGNALGTAEVFVIDFENKSNFDSVIIDVVEISVVELIEKHLESLENQDFKLTVTADFNSIKFTNCTGLLGDYLFESNINSNYIIEEISNNNSKPNDVEIKPNNYSEYANNFICTSKKFISKTVGEFPVVFKNKNCVNNNNVKSLFSEIRVYDNLRIVDYFTDTFTKKLLEETRIYISKVDNQNFVNLSSNNYVSIIPGSSQILNFDGGAKPWKNENFSITFKVFDENKKLLTEGDLNINHSIKHNGITISKSNNPASNNNSILIRCDEITTHQLFGEFTSTNKASSTLTSPVSTTITFSILCDFPSNMAIYFPELLNKEKDNEKLLTTSVKSIFQIPQINEIEYLIRKNSDLEIRLYGFDRLGRIINNINNAFKYKDYNFDNDFSDLLVLRKIVDKDSNINLSSINNNNEFISEKMFFNNLNSRESKFLASFALLKSHNTHKNSKVKYEFDSDKVVKKHSVKITIISNPSIRVKEILLLPWQNYSLDIFQGSGNFSIDINYNNNEFLLHDFIVEKNTNIDINNSEFPTGKLIIRPNNNNSRMNHDNSNINMKLTVTIKDQSLNNNFYLLLDVYVSSVKSITLLGSGLLMEEKTKSIEIIMHSYYDSIFPFSIFTNREYFKYFNLKYKALPNRSNLEVLEYDYSNSRIISEKYLVKGVNQGVHSLSVVFELIGNNNANNVISSVESNYIQIEVFEKISIYPPYLLMVPGTSFTVSISKGPSTNPNIQKVFSIRDKNIAFVEKDYPVVHAKLIGTTYLEIKIIDKSTDNNNKIYSNNNNINTNDDAVVCTEVIPIEVSFPEYAEILLGNNRKIFRNSSIRLLTILKKGSRVFTFGVGPIFYEWSTDQPLVAKLKNKFSSNKNYCNCKSYNNISNTSSNSNNDNAISSSNNDECSTNSGKNFIPVGNNIGIFVTSINKGEATITSRVTIEYPVPYKESKPNTFSTTERLLVDDNLFVSIAEFYDYTNNKSSLYLLPNNISHELKTNRVENNLVYKSIISNTSNKNLFSLTPNGRITTGNDRGIGQIIIDQYEKTEAPFVPVILSVLVTEFYSLFIEKSFQLLDIDVGQEQDFKVILQHEYGLLFAENLEGLKITSLESHPKIATSSLIDKNSKLRIRAFSKGKTNVVVYNPESLKIYDVFMIHVHANIVIAEEFILNTGAEINFLEKEPNRKDTVMNNSEWISTDPAVFYINSSGKGVAIKEGTSKVILMEKNTQKIKLSTIIRVFAIKQAYIESSSIPEFLTNYKENKNYKAHYKVKINFYLGNDFSRLSNPKEDQLNSIQQKIKFSCSPDDEQKSLFRAEALEQDESSYCLIYINDNPDFTIKNPSFLKLKIKILNEKPEAKDTVLESKVALPFAGELKLNSYFISLNSNKQSELIQLNTGFRDLEYKTIILASEFKNKDNDNSDKYTNNDNNVNDSDNLSNSLKRTILPISTIVEHSDENSSTLKVSVVEDLTKSFSVKILITNKKTNQTQECLINFKSEEAVKKIEESNSIISSTTITDLCTLLLIIASLFLAVKRYWITDNTNQVNNNQYRSGLYNSQLNSPNNPNINLNLGHTNPYLNYPYSSGTKNPSNPYYTSNKN